MKRAFSSHSHLKNSKRPESTDRQFTLSYIKAGFVLISLRMPCNYDCDDDNDDGDDDCYCY